ncbi:peptidoglycan editing factor PgeF [soil metagenome]
MVRVVASTRANGSFHLDRVRADQLERRRRTLGDLPWTMLDEVHGVGVVEVTAPGQGDRSTGDVLVTGIAGAALGVWVGDCAPVVLVGEHGRFAVVHAGWRGLASGVLDVAVAAVSRDDGRAGEGCAGEGGGADDGGVVAALLGPCIGPCCYEFGRSELAAVAAGVGTDAAAITSTTSTGDVALDVPAAVTAGLVRHGIVVEYLPGCTGCGGRHFSHRVRGDGGRHVLVAWKDAA